MSGSTQEPIRVLLFAGGGFGTSMQLGVAHALLVNRGKAPDLVVGVSAGAVNAVALAEILQAGGDSADEEQRLLAQTARFREVFSICQRAPGELFSALKPNSFQIDTQRPLDPLELPIHSQEEREWRGEALASRSGLMAVVNLLFELRLPMGSLVRGLRRVLGFNAAAEIPVRARPLVLLSELLHLLLILAPNLPRLAPLVEQLLDLPLSSPPRGGSAGELIFQSRALTAMRRGVAEAVAAALLIPVWIVFSALVAVLGPALVVVWMLLHSLGSSAVRWLRRRVRPRVSQTSLRDARHKLSRSWADGTKLLVVWFRLVLWIVTWSAVVIGVVLGLGWTADRIGLDPSRVKDVGIFLTLLWVMAVLFTLAVVARPGDALAQRFFARYQVAKSLFHYHPLRQIFVDLFDREYLATVAKAGTMDDVVARALDPARPPEAAGGPPTSKPKTIGTYRTASPPIRVGIVAAELGSGDSKVLDEKVPVVNALLAATAVSPIFPPQALEVDGEQGLWIDGVNIANEPTRPALTFLRKLVHELPADAPAVLLYPVSALPVSLPELKDTASTGADDRSLLEIVRRALELQRFRDATLERRLTELYSKAIPENHPSFYFVVSGKERGGSAGEEKGYLRAWVHPIEPERSLTVNRDLLRATSDDERRRVIGEAVADGCRAAMERMIHMEIAELAGRQEKTKCREAIALRLGKDPTVAGLPGSAVAGGPGVAEVCRFCSLDRGTVDGAAASLRVSSRGEPRWPTRDDRSLSPRATHPSRPAATRKQQVERALHAYRESETFGKTPWPLPRDGRPGSERPTVSVLFSGGVFRGVFQVGVLNALSEVGLEPDLVAGASVGAITAAMAARVFVDGARGDDRPEAVRRLAATYLAIDRLILTDRFSDFVRTLTVRGAYSRFSLRDLDRAFRRFDVDPAERFDKVAREVIAGIERLFWISPFELLDLTRALRLQDSRAVEAMLRRYFQEVLDRSGVGGEILGTEPLQLLIREHVLRGLAWTANPSEVAERAQFDAFLPGAGILFLATATNLDRGRLEVLGDRQLGGGRGAVSLLQGLLASSAFPGVFRPRWAWEVLPEADSEDRFADGGVMDNLPFDAVAHHLLLAAKVGLIRRRPEVPHLLFSASLEPDVRKLSPEEAERVAESWVRVLGRSRQLGFNQKLRIYENAQRAVRRIYRQSIEEGIREQGDFVPLDIEVVTVRPKWLCGTFAFHPMLGFRRRDQARSIAHGCASTLHRLAQIERRNLDGWGIDASRLPAPPAADGRWSRIAPQEAKRGDCWYRKGISCPFSEAAQDGGRSQLPTVTRNQLRLIYEECGRPGSHVAGARA